VSEDGGALGARGDPILEAGNGNRNGAANAMEGQRAAPVLRESPIWTRYVIEDIQTKAELGRYRMQGFSMHHVVHGLDELTFVPCTLSRVPLEGYREKCETRTVLGTRFAQEPVVLDRPITIAGMSYGALSGRSKTGDGGMCQEEREAVDTMVYQVLPSRYGFNPDHLKMAQAVEIVVGQGAKPGTGGVLLGSKVSEEIAEQRTLPVGVDQRSPVRHPDFIGPDDLQLKIEEVREATDWRVPVYVKMGASRVADDVKLAVKAGADVLVIDGMEGATGASPDALLDHTGIPTMSALCEAVRSLEEMRALGEVQLVISGGIRSGVEAAKALALGADAVSIGTAALIALNCNAPLYVEDYERLGTEPGFCHHCHTGRCPVGITTQDPELMQRLEVDAAADRVFNFLQSMTMEMQMIARACGKNDVHDLEAEDMRSLTLEASMITGIPLAGTDFALTPETIADVVAARLGAAPDRA
jgi:methylamine---glutamate N-methyltransferase subunit C